MHNTPPQPKPDTEWPIKLSKCCHAKMECTGPDLKGVMQYVCAKCLCNTFPCEYPSKSCSTCSFCMTYAPKSETELPNSVHNRNLCGVRGCGICSRTAAELLSMTPEQLVAAAPKNQDTELKQWQEYAREHNKNQDTQPDKEEIYFHATNIARMTNQTVGEKNEYYITLKQLEGILND